MGPSSLQRGVSSLAPFHLRSPFIKQLFSHTTCLHLFSSLAQTDGLTSAGINTRLLLLFSLQLQGLAAASGPRNWMIDQSEGDPGCRQQISSQVMQCTVRGFVCILYAHIDLCAQRECCFFCLQFVFFYGSSFCMSLKLLFIHKLYL